MCKKAINDQLKKIVQVEQYKQGGFGDFILNLIAWTNYECVSRKEIGYQIRNGQIYLKLVIYVFCVITF